MITTNILSQLKPVITFLYRAAHKKCNVHDVLHKLSNRRVLEMISLDHCSEEWSHYLSWRQTIDQVGQLLGRGLVSKDNRLMKCTTSKLLTCRVTNGGPIWSAFYAVSQSKIKQHKSVSVLIICHFFDVTIMTWQVTRVMVQRLHQPIVFGN